MKGLYSGFPPNFNENENWLFAYINHVKNENNKLRETVRYLTKSLAAQSDAFIGLTKILQEKNLVDATAKLELSENSSKTIFSFIQEAAEYFDKVLENLNEEKVARKNKDD